VTEYVWDCRDRLREVRLPGGDIVRYFYDAFGRRTRKVVFPASPKEPGAAAPPSRATRFLWDGDVLAAEIDTERGGRAFVHEPGTFRPLLQLEQGEVFLYVLDQIGTPRELLDAQGRVRVSLMMDDADIANDCATNEDLDPDFRADAWDKCYFI
jgi:YD repeat-containing protein